MSSAVPALTQPYGTARGIQEPFAIANPGANTNASFSVDGRGLRRLVALVFTLTTDGNAANRIVTVEYVGGDGLPFSVSGNPTAVTANKTQRFAAGLNLDVGGTLSLSDLFVPLAGLFLYPSNIIQVNVANKQVTDTLTNIRGVLERFPLDWYDLPAEVD